MSETQPAQPDETVSQLQRLLLTSVLSHQLLPGSNRPVELPDLPLLQADGYVRVSTENLAGPLTIPDAPIPIRFVTPEALMKEACERGDVTYLAFQPVEREENTVRLSLQGRIATCDGDRHPLGLSGLQVEFRRVDDHWEVATPPAAFAE